jgi:hypothetical protein
MESKMLDAYGTITVGGDYKGDISSLVKCLNKLKFHSDADPDSTQFVEVDGRVRANELEDVPYPDAYPNRISLEFEDGRSVFLDEASDSLIDEWRGEGGDVYNTEETCSPELLSRMISPWLTEGAIEFAAFAECGGTLGFSRLVVRSDGFVEFYSHGTDATEAFREAFVPERPLAPYL